MLCKVIPVATGDAWIGYGVRSFSSVIKELIDEAKSTLVLTVYLLRSNDIVEAINMALARGVRVEIYIYDDYKKIADTKAVNDIIALKQQYPYLQVRIVTDRVLHAKILVADGTRVLAGSANLTDRAMMNNYELGFLVEDSEIAVQILGLIQKMGSR